MKLYHGGIPGLKPGDRLLPTSEHGKSWLAPMAAEFTKANKMENPYRADRVYMCTDPDYAALYAQCYPRGYVYEVEPEGELEDDPDCLEPGVSFQAPAAKIISVVYHLSYL